MKSGAVKSANSNRSAAARQQKSDYLIRMVVAGGDAESAAAKSYNVIKPT
jgi:hypothetical protein